MKALLSTLTLLLGFAIPFAAHAAYGDPDTGYAPFRGGCTAIELREDGSAYVNATVASGLAVARLTPRGALDASWGTNGIAAYGTPGSSPVQQILTGKSGDVFAVDGGGIEHIDAAGRIDAAFGNAGRAELGSIHSAALQPDGKIVALVQDGHGFLTFVRLTVNGGRDESFGFVGTLPVPGVSAGPGSTIDPVSGYTYVFGWAVRSDGGVELGIYRDTRSAGHITPSLVTVPAADAGTRLVPQGVATWFSPLAKTEPTGALVIVGPGAKLARFTRDGSFDAGFGGTGVIDFYSYDLATPEALWREPDGAWTVVGEGVKNYGFLIFGKNQLRAIRLRSDGTRDGAFGMKKIGAEGSGQPIAHAADGSFLFAGDACSLVRTFTDAPRTESTVVEYYHPVLDHYFLTSTPHEITGLDAYPLGWVRTGQTFGGWAPSDLPGSVRVCRFYGDPVVGPNSHFYTGEDFECEGLMRLEAAAPAGVPAWHLESRPFSIAIPSSGQCPANLQPVYRVFNGPAAGGHGPNHRYTTDPAVYAVMQAGGWLAEGVHFCAPPRLN